NVEHGADQRVASQCQVYFAADKRFTLPALVFTYHLHGAIDLSNRAVVPYFADTIHRYLYLFMYRLPFLGGCRLFFLLSTEEACKESAIVLFLYAGFCIKGS